MICHKMEAHLKFSTWPQQPLIGGRDVAGGGVMGKIHNYINKYFSKHTPLTKCFKSRLTTSL